MNDKNAVDTLRSYIEGNSADPRFLQKVVEDARDFVPASQYGLVLWSHATSWKPAQKKVLTKSFGYDEGREMNIQEMAQYLPKGFEFIVFDACSMASIEVCYELRNHSDFILASPTEVLSSGYPYDKLTNYLFNGVDGLIKVAEQFRSYYNGQEDGLYRSATITLVDNQRLDELAIGAKKLFESNKPIFPFYIDMVQDLTFDVTDNVPSYDFVSFLKNNYTEAEYLPLQEKIQKAILYTGHTSMFLGNEISEYCGLSVYLPEENDKYQDFYNTLEWSRNSGWYKLFE